MDKSIFLCLMALSLCFVNGCFPRTTIPIPVLEYGRMDASVNKNLLILLRGMGGSPEDFNKHGLIQEVRSRRLPFDISVPNAHFGYYKSRTLEERLKHDLIEPARQKGYQQIWLAGFSMGGLGSLFYLRRFKKDVDGVILVSPFMGWENTLHAIEKSGGIQNWEPKRNSDNWQQLIWGWVKTYAKNPGIYPPIYLGYGTQDGMTGKGPVLLSAALQEERVFSIKGRHDYKTFISIWNIHLDRLEQRFAHLPR
jgi:pimeloyl-ACP methyl ester carboxylesterase